MLKKIGKAIQKANTQTDIVTKALHKGWKEAAEGKDVFNPVQDGAADTLSKDLNKPTNQPSDTPATADVPSSDTPSTSAAPTITDFPRKVTSVTVTGFGNPVPTIDVDSSPVANIVVAQPEAAPVEPDVAEVKPAEEVPAETSVASEDLAKLLAKEAMIEDKTVTAEVSPVQPTVPVEAEVASEPAAKAEDLTASEMVRELPIKANHDAEAAKTIDKTAENANNTLVENEDMLNEKMLETAVPSVSVNDVDMVSRVRQKLKEISVPKVQKYHDHHAEATLEEIVNVLGGNILKTLDSQCDFYQRFKTVSVDQMGDYYFYHRTFNLDEIVDFLGDMNSIQT